MNKRKTIRKIILFATWILVISSLGILLVAANHKQKQHLCRDVAISIYGVSGKTYIQKEKILDQIEQIEGRSLIEMPVLSVPIGLMEQKIKLNPWIRKAEIYFDSKDILHITVFEREPVGRVFTVSGLSFYIDSSGKRMPLLENESIRVPVVTGFTNAENLNASDSLLLNETKNIINYIYAFPLWNAQIGQIDITAKKDFELIPVLGNQIIKIGNGDHIADKMNRLEVFYSQVLSKVGFNKYAAIDLRFDGQVVAVKKGQESKIDSLQLLENIQNLMNRTNLLATNENVQPLDIEPLKVKDSSEHNFTNDISPEHVKTHTVPVKKNNSYSFNSSKSITSESRIVKNINPITRKPKAIMKKRKLLTN